MIVSYDCFLVSTNLNIFGSSKHLFKVFVSSFLPPIFIGIALFIFLIFKLILCKRVKFIWWILIAIITVIFNLYSSTSSLILSIFNCKSIEENQYLSWDLEIQCWKGSHARWAFLYGIPMIIFFVFGLPLIGALILFLNRNKLGWDYSWLVVLH